MHCPDRLVRISRAASVQASSNVCCDCCAGEEATHVLRMPGAAGGGPYLMSCLYQALSGVTPMCVSQTIVRC
jgi:hypothetical protein